MNIFLPYSSTFFPSFFLSHELLLRQSISPFDPSELNWSRSCKLTQEVNLATSFSFSTLTLQFNASLTHSEWFFSLFHTSNFFISFLFTLFFLITLCTFSHTHIPTHSVTLIVTFRTDILHKIANYFVKLCTYITRGENLKEKKLCQNCTFLYTLVKLYFFFSLSYKYSGWKDKSALFQSILQSFFQI